MLRHAWRSLGSWQTLVLCLGLFLLLVLLLKQYFWLPPYWDSVVNFYGAYDIAEHLLFPFQKTGDTGHPTFLVTVAAVVFRFGVSMNTALHLENYFFCALFLASTWRLGKSIGGEIVGWSGALAIALTPVVVSQTLQANLDLGMAAFGALAMAFLATGNGLGAGISAGMMALCKLNGVFGLVPIGLMSAYLIWLVPLWRTRRGLLKLALANGLPVAMVILYFLAKYLAVGRLADSGEFAGGKQVQFVGSLTEYLSRLWYTWRIGVFWVGLLPHVILLIIASITYLWLTKRSGFTGRGERSDGEGYFLSPGQIVALLLTMTVFQMLAQSVRAWPTLARYFIIGYPGLFLPTFFFLYRMPLTGRRILFGLCCFVLFLWPLKCFSGFPQSMSPCPTGFARSSEFEKTTITRTIWV